MVVYDPSLEVAALPDDTRRLLDISPPAAEGKPLTVSPSNESVLPTPANTNAMGKPVFGVSQLNMDCNGVSVRVLLLASPPNATKDLNDWRRLRIHLARVHTERECLKQVLRFLDTDRLQLAGYETAHDRLQRYLNAVFSRLNRPTFDGLPQDSLARAMQDKSEAITEEMRDRVLGQMASAQQALQAKAQIALATKGPVVNYNFQKEVVMTGGNIGGSYNQKVVVGRGGTIQGSVANGVIQDSFKSIESSDANDALKTELKNLTTLVQDMVGQLDETQAKRAANQLKAVTDEATAPSPDAKWYSVSSKGLLEAAEFAGEFATKIGASLANIAKLLGFPLLPIG